MRRRGFTLVELIVVMMLTVMLVGLAAAFMHAIAAARDVAANQLQGRQEALAALRLISTALRNGYRPVSDSDALFIGKVDHADPFPAGRLRFRTIERKIIRAGQPESDMHEVEFFLRDIGPGKSVLMRRTDPTENLPPDDGGVVEPIATDIAGLNFQYLDAGAWTDTWPERLHRWPTAISVELTFKSDANRERFDSVSATVCLPWSTGSSGTTSSEDSPQ